MAHPRIDLYPVVHTVTTPSDLCTPAYYTRPKQIAAVYSRAEARGRTTSPCALEPTGNSALLRPRQRLFRHVADVLLRLILPRIPQVRVDPHRRVLLARRQQLLRQHETRLGRLDSFPAGPGIGGLHQHVDGALVADIRQAPRRRDADLRIRVGGRLPQRGRRRRVASHAEVLNHRQPRLALDLRQGLAELLGRPVTDRREGLGGRLAERLVQQHLTQRRDGLFPAGDLQLADEVLLHALGAIAAQLRRQRLAERLPRGLVLDLAHVQRHAVQRVMRLDVVALAGLNQHVDDATFEELITDIKELAEHMMLIDLARNDLEMSSVPGSVETDRETIMHRLNAGRVMHIASEIRSRVNGIPPLSALLAIAPMGTVSGAPKVRSMKIIHENEDEEPRGQYAGSFGFVDMRGGLEAVVGLRSIMRYGQKIVVQAGAGIVYDSDDEREYLETVNKMKAALGALESFLAA